MKTGCFDKRRLDDTGLIHPLSFPLANSKPCPRKNRILMWGVFALVQKKIEKASGTRNGFNLCLNLKFSMAPAGVSSDNRCLYSYLIVAIQRPAFLDEMAQVYT